MYLIDTNVISEARKGERANRGVQRFFSNIIQNKTNVFLSVVTIGELRRGIDLIRHRGDRSQSSRLERWFSSILETHSDYVLEFDQEIALVWGKLRVPHPEHALDKQIAATALVHDLTVVTRNEKEYQSTGTRVINPFEDAEKL